jgi:hypothetical protein
MHTVTKKVVDVFVRFRAPSLRKTPSSFDRTVEPEVCESPEIIHLLFGRNAIIWYKINWIENYEVPLVEFKLQLKGFVGEKLLQWLSQICFSVVNQRN